MASSVSDERDPKLSRIIVAREGRLFSDAKNRRVTMRFIDGTVSETDTGDARRFRLTGVHASTISTCRSTIPSGRPSASRSRRRR